ncbi:MAG: hypothetical protein KDJ35_08255 [Alphaproteobacteria bacterium]|nr:hypothetical protein [Alphaproteobacteria bacterium]
MPITEERAKVAYSMFSMLGIRTSGDFKADTEAALKEFAALYNSGDDIKEKLVYPGEYTKEFGQQVVKAAADLQSRLKRGLENINNPFADILNGGSVRGDLDRATGKVTLPATLTKTEDKTKYLIDELKSIAETVNIFDEALEVNWEVEGATVENAPEISNTADTNTPFNLDSNEALKRYEDQTIFMAYKKLIYKEQKDIPQGQALGGDFYKRHAEYLNKLVEDAKDIIDDLPNEDGVEDLLEELKLDDLPDYPEREDGEADAAYYGRTNDWVKEVTPFIKAFTGDDLQAEARKEGDVSGYNFQKGGWAWNTPLSLFYRETFQASPFGSNLENLLRVTDEMKMAMRVQDGIEAKTMGDGDAIFEQYDFLQQALSQPQENSFSIGAVWNPGGKYAIGGQTIEDRIDPEDETSPVVNYFEEYKKRIRDNAPRGYLGKDFADRSAVYVNGLIKQVRADLKIIHDNSEGLGLEDLLSDKNDPEKWAGENWAQNAEAFAVALGEKINSIDDYGIKNATASAAFESITEGSLKDLKFAYRVNKMFVQPEALDTYINTVLASGSAPQMNADGQYESSAGDYGADGGSGDPIADSSLAVETVLQEIIAPMMQQNGVTLEFDGAPDGNFDVKSQEALQKFLVGASMQRPNSPKLADLGATPWLYTAENGGKLAAGLKAYIRANPTLVAGKVNDGIKEIMVKKGIDPVDTVVVQGNKVVWASDDPSGETLHKKGEELNEEQIEMLCSYVDPEIDGFIANLNLLDQNNKLSKKQLAAPSDLLPPHMNMLVTGIFMVLDMLGIELPESFIDKINQFTTKLFGIDIRQMMPEGSMKGLSQFVGGDREGGLYERMQDLYSKALKEFNDDPEKLDAFVKDGMKQILGDDPELYKACEEKMGSAMDKAKGILAENPDQVGAASKAFAAAVLDGTGKSSAKSDVNADNEASSVSGVRPGVDEVLQAGTFSVEMLNISTDVEIDYSNEGYTNPDAGPSKVYDGVAAIEEEAQRIMGSSATESFKEETHAYNRAHTKVSQELWEAKVGPQPIVDEKGGVKILFIDERRRQQIEMINERITSNETAIENYEKAVKAEMARIKRTEDKINGNYDDVKKESFRNDLVGYKANLRGLLNQDIDSAVTELYEQKALLKEMAGTEFRVVDANEEGYAEILKQHPNGKYKYLKTGEDVQDYVADELRRLGNAVALGEDGAIALGEKPRNRWKEKAAKRRERLEKREERKLERKEEALANTFNKDARAEKDGPEDELDIKRDAAAKRDEWKQDAAVLPAYAVQIDIKPDPKVTIPTSTS